jgi:hypothetical protein
MPTPGRAVAFSATGYANRAFNMQKASRGYGSHLLASELAANSDWEGQDGRVIGERMVWVPLFARLRLRRVPATYHTPWLPLQDA